MPLHVSSTCAHRQEVKIVLYSLWYHHTYRWPSLAQVERGLNIKINILRCTVSKISKHGEFVPSHVMKAYGIVEVLAPVIIIYGSGRVV